MKNNKGFTLTEILLAVMIVGIIGVALAALTTSAVREIGVGRTKMVLRNQLSLALRQLRQDLHQASSIGLSSSGCNTGITIYKNYPLTPGLASETVTYEFTAGSEAATAPSGSTTGGQIKRNGADWLKNVKKIPTSNAYPVPCFELDRTGDGNLNSMLKVNIIVEVPSEPVVNEVVEETFLIPHGISICNADVTIECSAS